MFGLRFRLRPATPGWGVGVCVFLCARSACMQPLLAGVCGVGVCAWARVSAAPCHSWLGCWGGCVFLCALGFHPATPGWGVRRGCLCLGSGFSCAPPLLAWALGCGCVCVRAPFRPRHSWLGCAVRVCVLGLRFRLRPAIPGWGVGLCVCLGARSACTQLLLAGVCGVGVCAWARVAAAPRHSWLVCVGVCVFGCALRLYSATPGWGVRCGCVCLDSGLGCALPLLAQSSGCVCVFVCALRSHPATPGPGVRFGCVCLGSGLGCALPFLAWVLGCECVCVRALLVASHSCLGCAMRVLVLGLGLRLRPAIPGWGVGVCVFGCALRLYSATPGWGVRCGCACLVSGFGCAPPLLARVSGCVFVFVCALRLYPATPGWDVRCGGVCLGSGCGCAPPLLAGVLGCVCVCVRAPLVRRHSWLGCAMWVCVLGLGFRVRPTIAGWVVGVCVCLCARSPWSRATSAGACGAGVCAWARISAAPRHSWLGCWVVRVFVCALGFQPAIPGWGVRCGCVCLGSGCGCAPPLLAGLCGLGVCVWARVSAVPRHSWLGWQVCVCLCARSASTPPLLAGVCGVDVCVWARVSAAPRHSWLG